MHILPRGGKDGSALMAEVGRVEMEGRGRACMEGWKEGVSRGGVLAVSALRSEVRGGSVEAGSLKV